MPLFGVFSNPYFPAFVLNTGIYRPEKLQTPNADIFHAATNNVWSLLKLPSLILNLCPFSREIHVVRFIAWKLNRPKFWQFVLINISSKKRKWISLWEWITLVYLLPITTKFTLGTSQPAITCSKLAIETPEQGVQYVQS